MLNEGTYTCLKYISINHLHLVKRTKNVKNNLYLIFYTLCGKKIIVQANR